MDSSSLSNFIKQEVPDWDDEVVATARFKAFSGQRSDWESKFIFWKDLILKVARANGVFIIQPSQVKEWFTRGGLTPLCIDRVLVEMFSTGEILRKENLVDSSNGRLYQLFKGVVSLMGISSSAAPEFLEGDLIIKALLTERATEVVKILSENHWTSFCIVTMEKFQSLCKEPNESSAILSYLSANGKVRILSINKKDFIEGVKVSLVPTTVPPVSAFDYNLLHLIWTSERLQQQLDVIDQRYETSRSSAIASVKSGNRQVALRHARQMKLTSESREKCTSLLNRVEEVLNVITDAESTNKVSEAIQIGAKAIKECGISIEEVEECLEELDDRISAQKQVEEALSRVPSYTDVEDEDVEDEFNQLEMELEDQALLERKGSSSVVEDGSSTKQVVRTEISSLVDSLSNNMSSLKLEAA